MRWAGNPCTPNTINVSCSEQIDIVGGMGGGKPVEGGGRPFWANYRNPPKTLELGILN